MTVQRTISIYADTRGPGKCKGCGAAITWAEVVKSGKRMCFTGDTVALTTRHDDNRRLIEAVPFDDNHWATCPRRDDFRRR